VVKLSGLAAKSEGGATGLVAVKTATKVDETLMIFRSEVLQKVVDESEKVLHNLVSVLHETADAAKQAVRCFGSKTGDANACHSGGELSEARLRR